MEGVILIQATLHKILINSYTSDKPLYNKLLIFANENSKSKYVFCKMALCYFV